MEVSFIEGLLNLDSMGSFIMSSTVLLLLSGAHEKHYIISGFIWAHVTINTILMHLQCTTAGPGIVNSTRFARVYRRKSTISVADLGTPWSGQPTNQ